MAIAIKSFCSAILNIFFFSIYVRYIDVFKKMYVMFLFIGESYCKDCDGFSHIEDQKSHKMFIHMKNNVHFRPAKILQ